MLRARTLSRALVFATMLSWAAPAAADVTIGGSCSGTVGYGPQTNGNNAACIASLWQYPPYIFGALSSTSTGCASTNAGQVQYNGGSFYGCNGSAWGAFATGGSALLGTSTGSANPQRSGDPTTGLLSLTTSTVSIETSGVEALRVTATQSVGIGTTSVPSVLSLYGSSNYGNLLDIADPTTTSYNGILFTGTSRNFSMGTGNGSESYYGVANSFFIDDNTANQMRFVINSSGYVGIGTTSPQSLLHVYAGEAQVGTSGASCSSTNAGAVRYASAALYFCDGTAWRNIEWSAASSTTPIFAAGAGYLVMSSGTWNGNMGGLSGADADCYSDLTSNNWMGKSAATSAGIVTSGQIHAWLCNSSNCGASGLYASTTYYFAISGDASHGGATITTDSGGSAGYSGSIYTSDGNSWAASNYFNGSYNYWDNVGVSGTEAFTASPGQALTYYSCDDWTSTSADPYGIIGQSAGSDHTRWSFTIAPCTGTQHLICVVQP